MSRPTATPTHPSELRGRAVSRITGRSDTQPVGATAALAVLHDLASSPSTAADALALLHELQVHQVELDLQADESRSSRAEVEAALARQKLLYECAPVGCFTVEQSTAIVEFNLTGAHLLGAAPETLHGRPLGGFLTARGGDALRALLARVADGQAGPACTLELETRQAAPHWVHATASADPAGPRFFIVLLDPGEREVAPTPP